jgi:hypothetical protein
MKKNAPKQIAAERHSKPHSTNANNNSDLGIEQTCKSDPILKTQSFSRQMLFSLVKTT